MRVLNEHEIEMMKVLFHLRYLGTGQIHRQWYKDRNLENCQTRLGRLAESKLLKRVRVEHKRWPYAWKLGVEGFKVVAEQVGEQIVRYRPLTGIFLPHLIETNDVFLRLAPVDWRWNTLPFSWHGSHRMQLEFTEIVRDNGTGTTKECKRVIRPDAVMASNGLRVFLE